MPNDWRYTAEIGPEADEFHRYYDDLPRAIAAGATEAGASSERGRAIVAGVRGRMKDGMDLPPPTVRGDGPRVALPKRLDAKAAVYSDDLGGLLSRVFTTTP